MGPKQVVCLSLVAHKCAFKILTQQHSAMLRREQLVPDLNHLGFKPDLSL